MTTERIEDMLFFSAAFEELKRARKKFPDEEGALTDAEWLAVLTEEVGEAARAIQDETDDRLHAELVQVAAMAARWARAIPAGRQRPPWAFAAAPPECPRCRSRTRTWRDKFWQDYFKAWVACEDRWHDEEDA